MIDPPVRPIVGGAEDTVVLGTGESTFSFTVSYIDASNVKKVSVPMQKRSPF